MNKRGNYNNLTEEENVSIFYTPYSSKVVLQVNIV
jgi:hypothetical protein